MAKKKKVNPRRVPLAKNAINKEEIVREAMENDMVHAWLLLAGPLLDEGYELTPLADAVNTYIRRSGDKNESYELRRAQAELGFPLIRLDTSRVKSPVELENYKRRVQRLALDTAICVLYLGMEKKIEPNKLKMIFFSADLTRAEIEKGINSYEDIERELHLRSVELERITIEY